MGGERRLALLDGDLADLDEPGRCPAVRRPMSTVVPATAALGETLPLAVSAPWLTLADLNVTPVAGLAPTVAFTVLDVEPTTALASANLTWNWYVVAASLSGIAKLASLPPNRSVVTFLKAALRARAVIHGDRRLDVVKARRDRAQHDRLAALREHPQGGDRAVDRDLGRRRRRRRQQVAVDRAQRRVLDLRDLTGRHLVLAARRRRELMLKPPVELVFGRRHRHRQAVPTTLSTVTVCLASAG